MGNEKEIPLIKIKKYFKPNPFIAIEELGEKIKEVENNLKKEKEDNKELEHLEIAKEFFEKAQEILSDDCTNYIYFWQIYHRTEEELLMVLEKEEFKDEALKIITKFYEQVKDKNMKEIWLGKNFELADLLKQQKNNQKEEKNKNPKEIIESPESSNSINTNQNDGEKFYGILPLNWFKLNGKIDKHKEFEIRTSFKDALKIIHDYYTDASVAKLNYSYIFLNLSTIILILILGIGIKLNFLLNVDIIYWKEIMFWGAVGAIIGNMPTFKQMPNEIFLMWLRGIVFKIILYHLVGKVLIGILSAFTILMIIKSNIIPIITIKDEYINVLSLVSGAGGILFLNKFIENIKSELLRNLEK